MKRRDIAKVIAPAAQQPKPAYYAVLIEYTVDRGAAVGFSLRQAVERYSRSGPSSAYITLLFSDGREIYLDSRDLTRPGMSFEEARNQILKLRQMSINTYEKEQRGEYVMWLGGSRPSEDDYLRWKEEPESQEVEEHRMQHREKWLAPEDLDRYEREHIAPLVNAIS